MSSKRVVFAVSVTALLLLLFVAAQPQSTNQSSPYHVSTLGSDSNPGTSSLPWRTIQKAADTLGPGETVVIQAGSYDERVQITRSGLSTALITFQTQGKVVTRGFNLQASYARINGFEVTNVPGNDLFNRETGSGIYVS